MVITTWITKVSVTQIALVANELDAFKETYNYYSSYT